MKPAKRGIQLIAETCRRKGIRKVVFSPGSRSAPFVIAFSQMPEIECMVIPDERVAGYFAMGIAQQLRETVAVVCTSGTAVLNLLPAACEACYQEIPLLFITADRPHGAVEMGENQAIQQGGVFSKYAAEIDIDADNDSMADIIHNTEDALFHTQHWKIPARINVHISEPLYETTNERNSELPQDIFKPGAYQNSTAQRIAAHTKLVSELNAATKKLVIIGLRNRSNDFNDIIGRLARRSDFVVLVESTSNTNVEGVVNNYDACLELINAQHTNDYVPNIVITLGNQIVSKRIRQFLRRHKPKTHWNIATNGENKIRDYFELNPEEVLPMREEEALECLLECEEKTDSEYRGHWAQLADKAQSATDQYLGNIEFSDFAVYNSLIKSLPVGANIQYGNSTPVRYSNFFKHKTNITVNSNRGTSGIDGCVSTATGAAFANQRTTVLMVGDISFFYDSNALWNNHLSPDLRIIIINNSGGNIFRLIDGPPSVPGFETFFETKHNLSARHLALMYNIPYYICQRQSELDEVLKTFYQPQNGRPAILEIKTDGEVSARVYKEYFKFLKEQNSK